MRRILCLILLLSLCSCAVTETGEYNIKKENIAIFKDTEAWDLAVAVKNQDTRKIEKIAKKAPEILNFQEPNYDVTLLIWAVGMEKYNSAEALLKCGADPNIIADGTGRYNKYMKELLENGKLPDGRFEPLLGETALFIASGFSWVDYSAKDDPKYVKLLLQYGADPNICYIGTEPVIFPPKSQDHHPDGIRSNYGFEPGLSPLMRSINCGIEKTKALVEAGADINHKTESGRTAAISSIGNTDSYTLKRLEYARYLIVEKHAKVTEPYFGSKATTMPKDNPNDEFYLVNSLRGWTYPLDSEEHKLKMEIVEEFARQGVNYWETEIPKDILEYIKKRYPDTWEEYILKY